MWTNSGHACANAPSTYRARRHTAHSVISKKMALHLKRTHKFTVFRVDQVPQHVVGGFTGRSVDKHPCVMLLEVGFMDRETGNVVWTEPIMFYVLDWGTSTRDPAQTAIGAQLFEA
jgi:hypothetical protein